MHIIGIIVAIATAVFWVGRAARGARDIADVASRIKKHADGLSGKENFSGSMQAAATLMVCIAQLSAYSQSHSGMLSEEAENQILTSIKTHMKLPAKEAGQLLQQARRSVIDIAQPETSLAPMTNILMDTVTSQEARELNTMLGAVAQIGGGVNAEQSTFLTRYQKRMEISA